MGLPLADGDGEGRRVTDGDSDGEGFSDGWELGVVEMEGFIDGMELGCDEGGHRRRPVRDGRTLARPPR